MRKILVLVEGQTEEDFVKNVLGPYLFTQEVNIVVTILNTKVIKDGPNFKGGTVSYSRVKKDIQKLLHDTSAAVVTTMFDYYALVSGFPGLDFKSVDCYKKVEHIENLFYKEINNSRFIPYIQLHEFEALLFSSPDIIADTMPTQINVAWINKIKNDFPTPEWINSSPETCPSRRLIKLYPDYNKRIYGSIISANIGIDIIRNECPHFDQWIKRLLASE